MPEMKRIKVKPAELKRHDIIVEVEFSDKMVISGKTRLNGGSRPLIMDVSTGKINAVINTDHGKVVVRNGADMHVRRAMPTAEEIEADKAEKAEAYKAFQMKSLFRKLQNTYSDVEAARANVIECAQAGQDADRIMRFTYELAEADARRRIAERMLLATGRRRNEGDTPLDLLTAVKLVAIAAAGELLDRGADDTWSGRGNDLRRATFDAQRDFIRSLRYDGVKVFDIDQEWY